MDDKKKVGLIVTLVTVFLCGCPGLCGLLWGTIMVAVPSMDNAEVTGNPVAVGIPAICLSVILILIPIAAGVYTLMQKKKADEFQAEVEDLEVPPAI